MKLTGANMKLYNSYHQDDPISYDDALHEEFASQAEALNTSIFDIMDLYYLYYMHDDIRDKIDHELELRKIT